MMADELLNAQDLITAKKHDTFHSEVITGKTGGLSTGADIDYATNAVTGQTQTTLPKVLSNVGFSPAGFDFTTGGTLTERDKAIFYQTDGNWYSWGGTLPKVVPPTSSPASTGGIADAAWNVSTSAFMYRDWEGFTDELLAQAGIVDDGQPDEIGNSQRVDAIKIICDSISRGLFPVVRAIDYLPSGFVTDGSIDYRAQIQSALNAAVNKLLLLPDFPVLIDPAGSTYGGLDVPSNSKIFNPYNGELRLKPNDLSNYEILSIRDKVNIEIYAPRCVGDKYTHTGTTGEFGMGISIRGACENIRIYNPRVYECWGDGYYIGQTSNTVESTPRNIHIINPEARKCRRQGMSVTSADGLFITNPGFWDTKSSDSAVTLPAGPHAGIDIEPNSENSLLRNIKIKGLHGGGNDAGLFYVYLGAIVTEPGSRYHVDIDVDSISDDGSVGVVDCIGLNKDSRYSGAISIGSVNSTNSEKRPVQLRQWPVQCRLPVNIATATLSNWKSPVGAPARDRAAVTVRYSDSDPTYPAVGNLHIGQLNLISTLAAADLAASAVFFENASGAGVSSVTIKMGYVFANTDLRGEGLAKADIDLGNLFGGTFKFKRDVSWTFLPNIWGDIEVTPSGGSPTCTMPDVYSSRSEGNSYRLKYIQGGTASFVRIRSNVIPMYCNGVQGTNFLVNAASGVVTLYIRDGAYYLHSLGPVTKES